MTQVIQKHWALLVAVLFTVAHVQLNTGCTHYSFACSTGFPVGTYYWTDVAGYDPYIWIAWAINTVVGIFTVALLFRLALPFDWRTWVRHGLVVLTAASFAWSNPWRPAYDDELDRSTGFPFKFRLGDVYPPMDDNQLFTFNIFAALLNVSLVFVAVGRLMRTVDDVQRFGGLGSGFLSPMLRSRLKTIGISRWRMRSSAWY